MTGLEKRYEVIGSLTSYIRNFMITNDEDILSSTRKSSNYRSPAPKASPVHPTTASLTDGLSIWRELTLA